jgi:hypothetical protein
MVHDYLLGENLSPWCAIHIGYTYMLNHKFTLLSACLADEIMSSTGVK